MEEETSVLGKFNCSWHHTMIRVKDPEKSLKFYQENFGMTYLNRYDFNQWKFSLYFLTVLPNGVTPPTVGTPEADQFLWNYKGVILELTHNFGTEKMEEFKYNNGNEEPYRGFGHIAFNTPDVYKSSLKLENNGVLFKKKPDEGRMKGLAFVFDPDGYWVEIVRRSENCGFSSEFNLSQTMLRVKDPKKSVPFFSKILGMKLINVSHHSDFSLYFMAYPPKGVKAPENPESEEAKEFTKTLWDPVLELTHNHGTENNEKFSYHNGNDEPKGFGHLAFLVDDVHTACAELEKNNLSFKKKPNDGSLKDIAFVYDPDGYHVEIIQRGLTLPRNL